jgi:flagellar protein FliL
MGNVLKILGTVGKTILYILLAISSLVILGAAYIVFAPDTFPKPITLPALGGASTTETVQMEQITEEPTEAPTVPGSGVMVDTGTKIINLAEPGGNKYIRIDVVLEFAQPPEVAETPAAKAEGEAAAAVSATDKLTNEINARMPMINDTIITMLSSKTFSELYTAVGKEALRGELMQKLQAVLPEYQIIGVYFTEFVVE